VLRLRYGLTDGRIKTALKRLARILMSRRERIRLSIRGPNAAQAAPPQPATVVLDRIHHSRDCLTLVASPQNHDRSGMVQSP